MGESFLRRECAFFLVYLLFAQEVQRLHANYRAVGASCASLHRRTASCHRQRCARKRFHVPIYARTRAKGWRTGRRSWFRQHRTAPSNTESASPCTCAGRMCRFGLFPSRLSPSPMWYILCPTTICRRHVFSWALALFISGSFVVAQFASLPCLPLLHILYLFCAR